MTRIALFFAIAVLAGTVSAQSPQSYASAEAGMYVVTADGFTQLLGQAVSFERTGSKLVSGLTFHIKAEHTNIQIPGIHAQTVTGSQPVFIFVSSPREAENGVTAGDLLLIRLEMRGDRRQIEIGALGAMRGSGGISITHQVAAVRSELASGKYQIKPAESLTRGEYALYLQRGEGLPAMLYDFSVPEAPTAIVKNGSEPSQTSDAILHARPGLEGTMGTVNIVSVPDGGDLFVDGAFVGDSPATLNLRSGEHMIRIVRSGYQDWEREMAVSGGTVDLIAKLIAAPGGPVAESTSREIAKPQAGTSSTNSEPQASSRSNGSSNGNSGWIGVTTNDDAARGVVITRVLPGSSASQAGLRVGDIIVELNGKPVKSGLDFDVAISRSKIGSRIQLGYVRGEWKSDVTLTIGKIT